MGDIGFFVFIGITFISIVYHLLYLFNFSLLEPKKSIPNTQDVSVILCAKNESENLKKHIPSLLDQNHPNFQVVLINDNSSDNSLKIMKKFEAEDSRVKVVHVEPVEKFWGNKKYALTLGIKAAKHDLLLFTDADCQPVSNNWIATMSSHFSNEKSIVLGYGAYKKIKGSFLNALIRYETFLAAVQYFSYAHIGLPYMGVGRNLAYRKSLFLESSGFIKHLNIKSGDDDLFVNQVATSKNTAICSSNDGFTESLPKKTFMGWLRQKRRHVSTASHYKPLHQILLGLFYFSQLLFWLTAIVLFLVGYDWIYLTCIIILRVATVMLILHMAAKRLGETGLIVIQPFLEIALIVSQFFIFIQNLISKPRHWK